MAKYQTLNVSNSFGISAPTYLDPRLIKIEEDGKSERERLRKQFLEENNKADQENFEKSLEKFKCPVCKLSANSMCLCGHLMCKNNHEFNEKREILHH